jgi:hypothetical protein
LFLIFSLYSLLTLEEEIHWGNFDRHFDGIWRFEAVRIVDIDAVSIKDVLLRLVTDFPDRDTSKCRPDGDVVAVYLELSDSHTADGSHAVK